jgi:hypothetical protein
VASHSGGEELMCSGRQFVLKMRDEKNCLTQNSLGNGTLFLGWNSLPSEKVFSSDPSFWAWINIVVQLEKINAHFNIISLPIK